MRFAHLTNFAMGGAVTVAYKFNDVENSDGIVASFSFCSPNDQFVKATGRKKAEARFYGGLKHQHFIKLVGSGVHESVMNYLTKDFMKKVGPGDGYSYECVAPIWLQGEILSDILFGDPQNFHADNDEASQDCLCTDCNCK